jgi:energy-converting hydrogenase Eha subunit B
MCALAWSLALVAAVFVVPAYKGQMVSSTGEVANTTATLFDENGIRVVAVMAAPLVITLLAWFGLHRQCARGSRLGTLVAWSSVVLLAALAIVGSLSVGPFMLPVVLLLVAAARATPVGPRRVST